MFNESFWFGAYDIFFSLRRRLPLLPPPLLLLLLLLLLLSIVDRQ